MEVAMHEHTGGKRVVCNKQVKDFVERTGRRGVKRGLAMDAREPFGK